MKNMEREMAKIIAAINDKGPKTKEEIEAILAGFQSAPSGKSAKPKPASKKDQSQELVYEAYERSPKKGLALIKKALELNPKNADAYIYLAEHQDQLEDSLMYYQKAKEAAIKTLGKKTFQEDKGYFWGIFETRPYMKALAGLATCHVYKEEYEKSIAIYQEMLELNPGDNQGVRYSLSTLLLQTNDLKGYEKLLKENPDEDNAHWNYNNVLYQFLKHGDGIKSVKALQKAHKSNPHVIQYLAGIKMLPDTPPQYIGRGDENEAVAYVFDAIPAWMTHKEAAFWLVEAKDYLK